MYHRLLVLFIAITLGACSSYINKERYEISVGESVDIYYTTNSCCYYCIPNKEKLKHIKFTEHKSIDAGKKDCEGCNSASAFTFHAKSVGVDTVELKHLTATMECSENGMQLEKYVIVVK